MMNLMKHCPYTCGVPKYNPPPRAGLGWVDAHEVIPPTVDVVWRGQTISRQNIVFRDMRPRADVETEVMLMPGAVETNPGYCPGGHGGTPPWPPAPPGTMWPDPVQPVGETCVSGVQDTPGYIDGRGYPCSRAVWRIRVCCNHPQVPEWFGYTAAQQADLIANCPVSCRMTCDVAGTPLDCTGTNGMENAVALGAKNDTKAFAAFRKAAAKHVEKLDTALQPQK